MSDHPFYSVPRKSSSPWLWVGLVVGALLGFLATQPPSVPDSARVVEPAARVVTSSPSAAGTPAKVASKRVVRTPRHPDRVKPLPEHEARAWLARNRDR